MFVDTGVNPDAESRADERVGTNGKGENGAGWRVRLEESWGERKRGGVVESGLLYWPQGYHLFTFVIENQSRHGRLNHFRIKGQARATLVVVLTAT